MTKQKMDILNERGGVVLVYCYNLLKQRGDCDLFVFYVYERSLHNLRRSLSLAGDITQKGYEKKRSKLLGAYLPQPPGRSHNSHLTFKGSQNAFVPTDLHLHRFKQLTEPAFLQQMGLIFFLIETDPKNLQWESASLNS